MYILQDPRLIATNLFYLNANKLLDVSYIILYTWTVAGDGGIYLKSFSGGPTLLAALYISLIFFLACGLTLGPNPGGPTLFLRQKIFFSRQVPCVNSHITCLYRSELQQGSKGSAKFGCVRLYQLES